MEDNEDLNWIRARAEVDGWANSAQGQAVWQRILEALQPPGYQPSQE